jgi:HD-like signal output (HDOD) protein
MNWLGTTLRLAVDPRLQLNDFTEHVASLERILPELLRVANSPLHGMEGRIARLERAVLILGQGAVAHIATGVLVAERTRAIRLGPIRGDALWLHSLQVGIGSELIARAVGRIRPGQAYCAGLLHDLGIVDLHEQHGERYAELLCRAAEHPFREGLEALERDALGETHSARGAALAASWGLPEPITGAIGAHHAPLEAPHEGRSLAAVVNAAHGVLRDCAGEWSDADPGEQAEHALEDLGLLPDEVAEIRALAAARVKEAAAVYR